MDKALPKTATLLKESSGHGAFGADWKCYRLSPPMWGHEDDKGTPPDLHECVVVSAVRAPFTGPETYIFAATADGEITNWRELDGSGRGDLDHEAALRRAGYAVVGP